MEVKFIHVKIADSAWQYIDSDTLGRIDADLRKTFDEHSDDEVKFVPILSPETMSMSSIDDDTLMFTMEQMIYAAYSSPKLKSMVDKIIDEVRNNSTPKQSSIILTD